MLSNQLIEAIKEALFEFAEEPVIIDSNRSVSGGDINAAYRVDTNLGPYFVKVNSATKFPGMFEAEAKGLKLLADADEILIPKPLTTGTAGNDAFLLMEFLESGAMQPDFWEVFGTALAKLHKHSAEQFGLDHDNYIGSLPQSNRQHASWAEFFIIERLEAQCRMARDNGEMDRGTMTMMERLFHKLEHLFPEEPPALLHGDLWSGNYHVGPNGEPAILDPAVYYGHREMDLGMTRLFGGFHDAFYQFYQTEYPLADDWENRLDVANLYPLLVHVNLFGGGYLRQVQSILKRFA